MYSGPADTGCRTASLRDIGRLPTPQGFLAEGTLCYTIRPALQRRRQSNEKVGASVARCPRTPPDAAKTSGLQIGLSNRLRGLSNRSIVVVGNYCSGPITVEPCRAKARPLRPRRSYFAPIMVEAPGTAPGSEWFIATAIYCHSRQAGTLNIGVISPRRKRAALAQGETGSAAVIVARVCCCETPSIFKRREHCGLVIDNIRR